jgi:hypothetical protein
VKEHRSVLAKILGDERLSPNRRFFAELICLYLDADQPPRKDNGVTVDTSRPFDPVAAAEEKSFFKAIILDQFGKSSAIQWLDSQDPAFTADRSPEKIEQEAGSQLRAAYDKFLPEARK